jgi:hypothetical protein
MSTFTLRGTFWGNRTTITWTDGKLESDDPRLVEFVQNEAASNEGRVISTGFADSVHDHLTNPYVAHFLIAQWFEERQPEVVYTDVPPIEPPDEEGAVM